MKSQQIEKQLYSLRRREGIDIDLYNLSESMDYKTGLRTQSVSKVTIRKALLMDMNSSTKFLYDLGTIMLGRDFSQGGFFGLDDKTVVFDRDELPKSFILKEGTFITFGNNNFRVAEYKLWDNSNYLLIKAKHVQADHIPTFHKRHSKSSLEVLSGVPS